MIEALYYVYKGLVVMLSPEHKPEHHRQGVDWPLIISIYCLLPTIAAYTLIWAKLKITRILHAP